MATSPLLPSVVAVATEATAATTTPGENTASTNETVAVVAGTPQAVDQSLTDADAVVQEADQALTDADAALAELDTATGG